jgi:hypothetical protein
VHVEHEFVEVRAALGGDGKVVVNRSISMDLPRPTPPHMYNPRGCLAPCGPAACRKSRAWRWCFQFLLESVEPGGGGGLFRIGPQFSAATSSA